MACCDPQSLWDSGYSATDIVATFFRMCKVFEMAEYLKLEFMRVRTARRGHPRARTCTRRHTRRIQVYPG